MLWEGDWREAHRSKYDSGCGRSDWVWGRRRRRGAPVEESRNCSRGFARDIVEHDVTRKDLEGAHRISGNGEANAAVVGYGEAGEVVPFGAVRGKESGGEGWKEEARAIPEDEMVPFGTHRSGDES